MHPEFQTHPITTYFIKVHPDSSNCRLFPQFTQVQPNAHAHLESTDKREHKKMRRGDWQGKRHLLRMCTMLRTLAIKKNIPHISIWYGNGRTASWKSRRNWIVAVACFLYIIFLDLFRNTYFMSWNLWDINILKVLVWFCLLVFLGLAANKKLQIFERNFRDIKFKVLNKLFTV